MSAAGNGIADVDVALTTRELARMINRAGLKFTSLPDEEFDAPLGVDTGAAVIFGATGGVMEAALRTANDVLTGKDNKELVFSEVRGTEGLKEATYNIAGMDITQLVGKEADDFRGLCAMMEAIQVDGKRLHTAIRYGLSQAILDAVAKATPSKKAVRSGVSGRLYKSTSGCLRSLSASVIAVRSVINCADAMGPKPPMIPRHFFCFILQACSVSL